MQEGCRRVYLWWYEGCMRWLYLWRYEGCVRWDTYDGRYECCIRWYTYDGMKVVWDGIPMMVWGLYEMVYLWWYEGCMRWYTYDGMRVVWDSIPMMVWGLYEMVLLIPWTSTRIRTKATTVNDQASIMKVLKMIKYINFVFYKFTAIKNLANNKYINIYIHQVKLCSHKVYSDYY